MKARGPCQQDGGSCQPLNPLPCSALIAAGGRLGLLDEQITRRMEAVEAPGGIWLAANRMSAAVSVALMSAELCGVLGDAEASRAVQ